MKKRANSGFTLIEMLVTVIIIVLLVLGITAGIRAGLRAYQNSIFESNTGTLSDILNTTIGDALRYSEDVRGEGTSFTFTNYEYSVRGCHFDITDKDAVDAFESAGYVTIKNDETGENAIDVPVINSGAYAEDLLVKDLVVSASKTAKGYYFDISYTIFSSKDPELTHDYTLRVRQANADVEVIFAPEEGTDDPGQGTTDPIDIESITIVYDGNVAKSDPNKAVFTDIWGNTTSSITQDVDPKNPSFRTYGDGRVEREHYSLVGWNSSSDGSGRSFAANGDELLTAQELNTIKENGGILTLYAQWSGEPLTLTLHAWNAAEDTTVYTYHYGDTVGSVANNFQYLVSLRYKIQNYGKNDTQVTFPKENTDGLRTFAGWTNETPPTGYYAPGSVSTLASDHVLNGITDLYAVWGHTPKVPFPDPNTFKNADWLKTWTFDGWSNKAKNSSVQSGGKTLGGMTDVYAVMHRTLNYYDDKNALEETVKYYSYENPSLKPVSKDGFSFAWYTTSDRTTKASTIADVTFDANGNGSLYGKWEENTYKITYKPNGANGNDITETVKYSDVITVASKFSKSYTVTYDKGCDDASISAPSSNTISWSFLGWDKSSGASSPAYTNGSTMKELTTTKDGTVTLYAIWTNKTVTLPAALSRTGYDFLGWSDGSTTYNAGNSYTPSKDVKLTAQWKVHTHKISTDTDKATITLNNVADANNVPYGSYVSFTVSYNKSKNTGYIVETNDSAKTELLSGSSSGTFTFIMPDTDVMISASSGSSACIASGTLITMADGTQKKIEDIKKNENVIVFNHETGCLDSAPFGIIVHDNEEAQTHTILNLVFDDGTEIKVIKHHGFFDVDQNKYVYIDSDNYKEFFGDNFYAVKSSGSELEVKQIKLVDACFTSEFTRAFAPISQYHLNYFTNGVLAMTSSMDGLFNIFELDDNMKYDEAKMKADIEKHGLYSYDDFKEYIPYAIYRYFPAEYFKVSVGKGMLTFDHILELINEYSISVN